MTKRFSNPKLFRELNQPFESVDAANAANNAFFEELATLREKYKVANLYMIISGSYIADDDEHEFCTSSSYGDASKPLAMTAWAHGREEAIYAELIASLRKAGSKLK